MFPPNSVMTIVEKTNAPTPARTASGNSVRSTLIVTLPQEDCGQGEVWIFAQIEHHGCIAVAFGHLDLKP
jgi:hypothetical protein